MSQPSTAIIVLGDAMLFKPSNEVLSVTVTTREQLCTCLDEKAAPDSLETLHMVLRANAMENLYDSDAIKLLTPSLREEGQLTVHVLEQAGSEHADTIKMSMVLAELFVEEESESADGSRTVTGRKTS